MAEERTHMERAQNGPASNPLEELEKRSEKNLWLWRLNETSDPNHVKAVSIGRKFSAIDAYYQIKRATETFGPVGIGWGWDTVDEVLSLQGPEGERHFAKCKITIWYRNPESGNIVHTGPVIGMNQLMGKTGVPDDEAFKKATTDGITKSLSYLGFSADVFMGLFDDSKYVDRLRKEANQKVDATGQRLPETCLKAIAELPKLRDLAELNITWKALTPDLKTLPAPALDFMKARFAMRKKQLAPEPSGDQEDAA